MIDRDYIRNLFMDEDYNWKYLQSFDIAYIKFLEDNLIDAWKKIEQYKKGEN